MSERPARVGLTLRTKLGFGVGDLGGNLFFTIIGFYLLFYLTDIVGMAAGLAGTAMMVGKFWDAGTDPVVGFLSDRTRSRLGRRRPYIFYGSFALAAAMVLMFTDPGLDDPVLLFVWAVIVVCFLNGAFTVVNIPYQTLLPELTRDYNERTVLAGFRMSFAVVGTFIGAGLVIPITGLFDSQQVGWTVMGAIMGGIMMATALITFWAVREPRGEPSDSSKGFFRSYLHAFKTRAFRLILLPYVLHMTGVTIIQGALLYYFTYVYEAKDMFQFALLALLASSIVFIPIWVKAAKRLGKKLCYNLGMGWFSLLVLVFAFTAHLGDLPLAFGLLIGAGIGFATHYVMPHAILPDVVEYDYAHNGMRREGVFYSLWTFSSKLGQALAIGINGWVLDLFNYVPNVEQSDTAILGIRLLCGPIPALFFITGIVVLSFYPITPAYYQKLQEMVQRREAEEAARSAGSEGGG